MADAPGSKRETPPLGGVPAPPTSTPLKFGLGSNQTHSYTYEDVKRGLVVDWAAHHTRFAPFEEMVNIMYPGDNSIISPVLAQELPGTFFKLSEDFSSSKGEVAQYAPIAEAANRILATHYRVNNPTNDKPGAIFVPLGNLVIKGLGSRKPDLVVLLRDKWEEALQWPLIQKWDESGLKKAGLLSGKKHDDISTFFITCSEYQSVTDLTPQDIAFIDPPLTWDMVIAVFEFKTDGINFGPTYNPGQTESASAMASQTGRKRRLSSANDDGPSKRMEVDQSTRGAGPSITSSMEKIADGRKMPGHIQLLGYIAELMAFGCRSRATGVIVAQKKMYLLNFEREGGIVSEPISLEDGEDLQAFARWVIRLGSRTYAELGFITQFGEPATQVVKATNIAIAPNIGNDSMQLELVELLHRQYGVFGRGTRVYKANAMIEGQPQLVACKLSWQVASRKDEDLLISKARKICPDNVPKVYHYWQKEVPSASRRLQTFCRRGGPLEQRIVRGLVMPFYQPLYTLEGKEFLQAFVDIMECVVKLYNNGLHHRDLSASNMMYHIDEGKIVAVLIDFDLAKDLEDSSHHSSRHRSGTVPFMASSLLRNPNTPHTLHEDFESACYILVWTALGYRGSALPESKKDPLAKWKNGSLPQIAAFKLEFFSIPDSWQSLSTMIMEPYKILRDPIAHLRKLLHRYHESHAHEADQDPLDDDIVPHVPTISRYLAVLRKPLEE